MSRRGEFWPYSRKAQAHLRYAKRKALDRARKAAVLEQRREEAARIAVNSDEWDVARELGCEATRAREAARHASHAYWGALVLEEHKNDLAFLQRLFQERKP